MHRPELALSILAVAFSGGLAAADDLLVPSEFETIQDAVDAAQPNDTIILAPGTYMPEPVIVIDVDGLTITGEKDASQAVIQLTHEGQLFRITAGTVCHFNSLSVSDGSGGESPWIIEVQGQLNITGCEFENNMRSCVGGVPERIEVRNSQFTNNHANSESGGAIDARGGFLELDNCQFHGNSAPDWGGAVSMQSGAIDGCTFSSNAVTGAKGGGGAIAVRLAGSGQLVNMQSNTFASNTSAGLGGAIYGDFNPGHYSINAANFTNNSANSHGGAIYIENAQLTSSGVGNSDFISNTSAEGFGGGIYGSRFLKVSQSEFYFNSARVGGGIFARDAKLFWATFLNNTGVASSGAAYLENGLHQFLTVLENSTNGVGGGLFLYGEDIRMEDSTITSNQAGSEGGGGIYLGSNAHLIAENVTICENGPDQLLSEGILDGTNVLICDELQSQLGACCLSSGECVSTTVASCSKAGGTFAGANVECDEVDCPTGCPEDLDNNGHVDVSDLLQLLAAWGLCAG